MTQNAHRSNERSQMEITRTNTSNAERRLLRLLTNYGPQRQRTAYNRCGRGLTEDQFTGVVSDLQKRDVREFVEHVLRRASEKGGPSLADVTVDDILFLANCAGVRLRGPKVMAILK